MDKIRELQDKIQHFREYLHDLVKNKKNLQDPEVITASKMLDSLLNEYCKLLKNEVDKKS